MVVRDRPNARTDRSGVDHDRPVIVFAGASVRSSRLAGGLRLVALLLVVAALGAGAWWGGPAATRR